MKRFSNIFFGLVAASTSMFLFSCHNSPSGVESKGNLYLHLHSNIDTNEIDDGATLYPDGTGRHFSLSTAQFYISNIVLKTVDGKSYSMANVRIIKGIDSEIYYAGNAPIGTYNSITFDVGLDDAANSLTPGEFTVNSYLSNTDMWYGNTSQGYALMKLKGYADTTAAQSGTNLVRFSYTIGNTSHRKTITMPVRGEGSYATFAPIVVTAGGQGLFHITCDYAKVLAGVNFKTEDSTDTYNYMPGVADSIAGRFADMFEYED